MAAPRVSKEWIAQLLAIALIAAAVGIPLAARSWLPSKPADGGIQVDLEGRVAESGGWMPEMIQAEVGQPVHLRLTSVDVMHGFAIGQMPGPALDMEPGKVVETTLVFDQPGKYMYYCTRWCGPNHWRMRGTIEITGAASQPQPTAEKPLFITLGIDIDAPHPAPVLPARMPSAEAGAQWVSRLPAAALKAETYRTTSPAGLFQLLRADARLRDLADADLWDAVAYLYALKAGPERLALGKALYTQNCAACHGVTGRGDGVMMDQAARLDNMDTGDETNPHAMEKPDFTDPVRMLGASPALLEGKIIRGGMGTGMPYWGPIFTQNEIDALVAYLYTLTFTPAS